MPLFEFVCRGCGEKFEALVMGSRTASCPRCGGEELERQLSTFAFRSAGSVPGASSGSRCSGCAGGSCASCR